MKLVTNVGVLVRQQILLWTLTLSDYIKERMFWKIIQRSKRTDVLRKMNAPHFHELHDSFLSKRFKYSSGMLQHALEHSIYPENKSRDEMLLTSPGNINSAIQFPGTVAQCPPSVPSLGTVIEVLTATLNDKPKFLSDPVRVSAICRKDRVQFSPFETIKFSRQSHLTTAIDGRIPGLWTSCPPLLHFENTLHDEDVIVFSDYHTLNIALYMLIYNFSAKEIR